jgi:hypothetical protein
MNKEFKKLSTAPHSSRNAAKRSIENTMDRFPLTKVGKKLSSIYFPVDKTQLQKNIGSIPTLLMNSIFSGSSSNTAKKPEIIIEDSTMVKSPPQRAPKST